MLTAIKNTIDGFRDWNEDRAFSKHFRKVQVLDREIASLKDCLKGTVPNDLTDIYISYLNRKLDTAILKRIKATKRFNKVIDSFRS